jgi:hypothetical protein
MVTGENFMDTEIDTPHSLSLFQAGWAKISSGLVLSHYMAELITVVTSIDPLAPYKVCDDLILELVNVTATVEDDLEDASVGTWWFRLWSLTNWSNTNGREGGAASIWTIP